MAIQKEFRRSLLDASLARLKERPGAGLLGYCAADPDLSVFLRGDALDVYWEGLVVFHVALPLVCLRRHPVGDEVLRRSQLERIHELRSG